MNLKRCTAAMTSTWGVYYVGPSGSESESEKTLVDSFPTENEAEQACEYLNQTRDAAQSLDGTIYLVSKEVSDVDSAH